MKSFINALAARREAIMKSKSKDEGFTLIELIVVVLIIGILVAIAVPVFIGQQQAAQDGVAKANLAEAKLAWVSYFAANPGAAVADATPAALADYGWPSTATITINATTPTDYCFETAGGNGQFNVQENTSPAAGGCSA